MNKYIISLSFGNYLKSDGGVDKAISDYQRMFNSKGIDYLHISPVLPNGILKSLFISKRLYTAIFNGEYKGFYDNNNVWNFLKKLSASDMNCVGVHIHHTKKFEVTFIQKIIENMNAPVYFFLHDYYSICEHPNLLFNDDNFCGSSKKKDNLCEKCKYGIYVDEHISNTVSILKTCKELYVVSPSEVTLEIWKKTYSKMINNITYLVIPHQQPIGTFDIFPKIDDKIRIGFIGRYGNNKGRKQWEKLVDVVEKRKLPYELYYLGFSEIPNNSVKKIYVKVDPQNPDKMLEELRNSGINCAFLWSICPETYSYAYFEAVAANLFVITDQDSGNISYMVHKNENGLVYHDFLTLMQDIIDGKRIRASMEQFINDRNKKGPLSYIPNPQITELYGREEYNNMLYDSGDKVNFVLKRIMEYFYLKKNKN